MSQVGFLGKLKQILGKQKMAPLPASHAEMLYHHILQASRRPILYRDYGVEDSIDGRFDALCLFQSLMMRRLAGSSEALSALSQELFDAMFADMDLTLREMGVGDMGVGKRVKFMSEAYMGRLTAYDKALKADTKDALQEALLRNLYRIDNPQPEDGQADGNAAYHDKAGQLADEVYKIVARLEALEEAQLLDAMPAESCLAIAPRA